MGIAKIAGKTPPCFRPLPPNRQRLFEQRFSYCRGCLIAPIYTYLTKNWIKKSLLWREYLTESTVGFNVLLNIIFGTAGKSLNLFGAENIRSLQN